MKEIMGLVAVRSASKRLKGKAFRLLNGKPVLQVLIDRLKNTNLLDGFIICTTKNQDDNKIEDLCGENGVMCFRGESENVMKRFLDASSEMPSEYIARITGDNPLTDFVSMRECFEKMKEYSADYGRPVGVPLGTACEVVKRSALKVLHQKSAAPELSEYMTYFFELAPFIKKHNYEVPENIRMEDLRLTIDFEEDLKFVETIIAHFNGNVPAMKDIVAYCRSLPDYPKVKNDEKTAAEIKSRIKFLD